MTVKGAIKPQEQLPPKNSICLVKYNDGYGHSIKWGVLWYGNPPHLTVTAFFLYDLLIPKYKIDGYVVLEENHPYNG